MVFFLPFGTPGARGFFPTRSGVKSKDQVEYIFFILDDSGTLCRRNHCSSSCQIHCLRPPTPGIAISVPKFAALNDCGSFTLRGLPARRQASPSSGTDITPSPEPEVVNLARGYGIVIDRGVCSLSAGGLPRSRLLRKRPQASKRPQSWRWNPTFQPHPLVS